MKYLSFLFSLVALGFSFLAYENTKALEQLRPLAEVVSNVQAQKAAIKEKAAGVKEKLGKMFEDLAEEIGR